MKKVLVLLVVVLFTVLTSGVVQAAALTYADLTTELRYRLAETSPDFEDQEIEYLIVMGKIAAIAHSASDNESYVVALAANQQYEEVTGGATHGSTIDVMFVRGVTKISGGSNAQRSLSEVSLKDIGHRHLDTDVALSYYCFYRDSSTTQIYVFPPSTAAETLRVDVVYGGFSNVMFYINPAFLDAVMSYALFGAYIRLENWSAAADAYNDYRKDLAVLRDEIINRQPDVSVGPKIIE